MTKLQRITAMTSAFAFTTFLGASMAIAQQPQPNPSPTPDPTPAPQLWTEPPDTKATAPLKGELVRVDTAAKMLTIKTAEGRSEQIAYNDDTKVTGAHTGIAGLVNQDGTQVTVKFTGIGTARVATEIMVEKGKS